MSDDKDENAALMEKGEQSVSYSHIASESAYIEDDHTTEDLVKACLFGALDGILTSFAIVSGATGGNLSSDAILLVGISSLFANALSMGIGEYLSSKAHNDYVEQARKREEWHVTHNRGRGMEDMVDIYTEKGMEPSDARELVRYLGKYENVLIEALVCHELGLQTYAHMDECNCIKEGLLMFLSFIIFGLLPLLPYVLFPRMLSSWSFDDLFCAASFVTGLGLFAVGSFKSSFSARGWFFSGMETLILGGACAGLAYEIATVVSLYVL